MTRHEQLRFDEDVPEPRITSGGRRWSPEPYPDRRRISPESLSVTAVLRKSGAVKGTRTQSSRRALSPAAAKTLRQ